MKVACIGNMNNNAFSLTRHLRDRGIDAELLLLDIESAHFHPAMDSYDLSFQRFTRTLTWGAPFGFSATSVAALASELAPYDFIIATGSSPAFVHRAGRRADVFMPYGTDLIEYPFFRITHPRYQLTYARFARAQRAAIEASRCVHLDVSNAILESYFERLDCRGTRLVAALPAVYTPIHNPQAITSFFNRTHWAHEFQRIRDAYDIVIFHHGRHYWRGNPGDINNKANDKLIRGFAEFVTKKKTLRACLVTMEYGRDVAASKELVAQLGIEKNVFWFPLMARKDLMVGLSMADIATGEFHRSWFSFGAMYEALAMAKPFMHYRDDSLYRDSYPELYPLINVFSAEEITSALLRFAEAPSSYRALGELGRRWLQKYVIDDVIDHYERLIAGECSRDALHTPERLSETIVS